MMNWEKAVLDRENKYAEFEILNFGNTSRTKTWL